MITKEQYQKALNQRDGYQEDKIPIPPRVTNIISEYEAQIAAGADTPIYTQLKIGNKHGVTEEKARCIHETVDELLSTEKNATDPGLLLGKIQCGKTDTFEMIIGLAFDKGFDIAVVLTKNSNALVKQTVSRLKDDYYLFLDPARNDNGIKIVIEDVMDKRDHVSKSEMKKSKFIWVVKKEATNLKHLIARFEKNPELKNKRVLIVDDEADFASRNYRNAKLDVCNDEDGNPIPQDVETELAKISQLIDDFRNMSDQWRYLQVTATPYCLFLQPDEKISIVNGEALCFRPRFTKIVPVHNGYIGGQQYFVDSKDDESMFSHVYKQVNQECVNRLGGSHKKVLDNNIKSKVIEDLTKALVGYLMATAVRRLQENRDYCSSAVVHVSVATNEHGWQYKLITRMLESIRDYFDKPEGSDVTRDAIVDAIYEDFKESNRKARETGNVLRDGNDVVYFTKKIEVALPSKEEIRAEVDFIFKDNPDSLDEFVKVVNSTQDLNRLIDETNGQLNIEAPINIFIGGNNLDRGITINNMLLFFYGRDPGTFQQDTVLQHARFYGARAIEDMAVTRLYTTPNIYSALERMNALDEDLRQRLIKDSSSPIVFIGYDENVKPCANAKIAPSKTIPLGGDKNIAPRGMQTGSEKEIAPIVAKIDSLIENAMTGVNKDEYGFFRMKADVAKEILALIEETYRYGEKYDNLLQKKDMEQLRAVLDYCLNQSDGRLFALYATDRDATRIKKSGIWNDMPADGHTQLGPAKEVAKSAPVLILLRQKGEKAKGWRNTPFYWPVLKTQEKLGNSIFASGLKAGRQAIVKDLDVLTSGLNIPQEEILSLTYDGDLVGHFGPEGTVYEKPTEFETRAIRKTNAGTYLTLDKMNGGYACVDGIDFDEDLVAGIYSFNHGKFPFVLRPYKYLILRQGRNAKEAMLLKLFPIEMCSVYANPASEQDGNLIDAVSRERKILLNIKDVLTNAQGVKEEIEYSDICQWVVEYPVKEVMRHMVFEKPLEDIDLDDSYDD